LSLHDAEIVVPVENNKINLCVFVEPDVKLLGWSYSAFKLITSTKNNVALPNFSPDEFFPPLLLIVASYTGITT
jgi:hypothetical protein